MKLTPLPAQVTITIQAANVRLQRHRARIAELHALLDTEKRMALEDQNTIWVAEYGALKDLELGPCCPIDDDALFAVVGAAPVPIEIERFRREAWQEALASSE